MDALTRKFKSNVAVVACLAAHYKTGPVHVDDISDQTNLSVSYLEKLFEELRDAKIVQGVKGRGGGYILCRPPSSISLLDIVFGDGKVESEVDAVAEVAEKHCKFLAGITLDRLS